MDGENALAVRSDVQRMLAESVESFTRRATDLSRVRAQREQFPGYDRQLWEEMAGLGWTGLLIDEEHGGSGLGLEDMAVVAEGLAAQLVPEPLATCAVLSARTLARCDATALVRELLRGIASGGTIAAVAFQERAGTLIEDQPSTVARIENDNITVSGEKVFVAGGAGADGFVVSASAGNGTVLLWVPGDCVGMSLDHCHLADGRFSSTLKLDGVKLASSHLLARENNAPAVLSAAVAETTAVACAELAGLMGTALDMTLEYLRTRVQFGKAIGSFQSLQHRSVDLFIQQQLARASLADALRALSETPDQAQTAATVSRAKARCSDAAALVTRQAIQMHGAIGFTEDSDVGLFVKRALTLASWLGNSAWHRRRFQVLAPIERD